VRFTTKGKTLYAFFMGWPEQGKLTVPALAQGRPYVAGKIERVKILGSGKKLVWTHGSDGLAVQLPAEKPCEFGCVLKVEGLEV
jgi:alpha-L-fucosidase